MSKRLLRSAVLASVSIIALPSFAQETAPPDLVITANKQLQSIQEIGSAVTVISHDEIEKQGPKSVRDLLEGQPGVDVTETGGPGGITSVYLRGTEGRHTLVLVDGVRANDISSTGGETDLSLISPQIIDRIEIVRGPQSALYGSDAIGGVINIITKRGKKGPPVWIMRTEGGSYGTVGSSLSVAGATDDLSYAFALNQFHSNGFQRYGYRVDRLAYLHPNGDDPFTRLGGSGKVSYRINDWLTLEAGFNIARDKLQYDAAGGLYPLAPDHQEGTLATAYQRAIAVNGPFRTTLTTFQSRTVRDYDSQYAYTDFFSGQPVNSTSKSTYVGNRVGAEFQEDIDVGQLGKLTFGTRFEHEKMSSEYNSITPFAYTSNGSAKQDTKSAYALYQLSLFGKLHLSAGGRVDHVSTSGTFGTYRFTAAYDLTGSTRVHASYGTGAKAPSLYQLTAPYYGNPNLRAETSRGFDVGIDQTILDGDAKVGVTYFNNGINNLITADAPFYRYYNVARVATSGIEVSGEYNVVPTFAKIKAAYTYLDAKDLSTGLPLYRRPTNSGRISVAFTPIQGLTIEPIARFVGRRDDAYYNEAIFATQRVYLNPYARFDLVADYKVNQNVSIFARAENLTNVKYEDVYNYGTPGRSLYAGLQVTW